MSLRIISPYSSEPLPWLQGNLHTHTTNSDGEESPQATVDAYAALGHDFLMISDHDCFTDPETIDDKGMALIPGVEVSQAGPHVLTVGSKTAIFPCPDRQRVVNEGTHASGFAVFCHPNWEEHFNHCPQEQLERVSDYAGIEIVNAICCLLPGSGLALDKWDRLLGQGRRIWGFANDDAHWAGTRGWAWNAVQCEHRDPKSIIAALKSGRFYATTGVRIDSIRLDDSTVHIESPDAQRIIAYGDYQRTLGQADGSRMRFCVSPEASYHYVRFECWGAGGRAAWTQPFFIERTGC